MLEYHQKDTVNSVACGKEQHVTVEDVYEMSQNKNGQYRWKRAFQFPPLLQTFPLRSRHQEITQTKFSARMKMDCAEAAAKLRTYVQDYMKTFEEDLRGKMRAGRSRKRRVNDPNGSQSMDSAIVDMGTITAKSKFSKRVFTASSTDVQKQLFATMGHDSDTKTIFIDES